MTMRDPYSQEAEQAVLGAMLIKPELIDVLAADLKASDFFFSDNRDVFKAIMELKAENQGIDFLTVSDRIGTLANGEYALGYVGKIQSFTPSVANAKSYARVIVERSVDRALAAAAETILELATSTVGVEDKIAQAHAQVASISSGNGENETITAKQAIEQHVEELERREQMDGKIDGLTTGIEALDEQLLGLKGGQLIIIAGRPKMGKTTLAMNIADHNAVRCKKNVLAISLEMSHKQLMDKSLASIGRIPYKSLRDGTAIRTHGDELFAASTLIANSSLHLYNRKGASINQIRSMARRHKMKYGRIDLLIVDHIGLVKTDDPRASQVQVISEITRELKLLAQELDCPVIALSQLNRALEMRPNKRPIPSDLRDSGSVEQDADLIMFVYRDEVYHENSEWRGTAEIIIAVARDIEACTVRVRYEGKYSLFSDLSKDYETPTDRQARRQKAQAPSLLD